MMTKQEQEDLDRLPKRRCQEKMAAGQRSADDCGNCPTYQVLDDPMPTAD